jgi:hypothetical protein
MRSGGTGTVRIRFVFVVPKPPSPSVLRCTTTLASPSNPFDAAHRKSEDDSECLQSKAGWRNI